MSKTVKEPTYQLNLFAKNEDYSSVLLDKEFPVDFANSLAHLESYNKHLYRPNTYLHKWWARRCGSTFRLILKHLVRTETLKDYYAPGGLEGKIILDPMMGGGTTLHEAIRLGANVIGADIDPIPVLQARATLSEISPGELDKAFDQFFGTLRNKLEPLYLTTCPTCERTLTLQYVLYGLRRSCQCSESIFVDSYILRHNSDGSIFQLDPLTHDVLLNNEVFCRKEGTVNSRLLEKKSRSCSKCGVDYQEDYEVPYYQRYEPIAIFADCPQDGIFFAPPRPEDKDAIAHADRKRAELKFEGNFAIEPGPKSNDLMRRGISNYLDLFSSRQLLYLTASEELLSELNPLLRLNFGLLVSTSLEFNSMLCGYKGAGKNRPGAIRHTFAHHAYSFPYTALENNPVYSRKTSGTLKSLFHHRIHRARRWALQPVERIVENGKARKVQIDGERDIGMEVTDFADLREETHRFLLIQGTSASLDIPDKSVDFIVTDPPYFDSVQYSDLAAFFRVWLRVLLSTDVDWNYEHSESAVDPQSNGNGQYRTVLEQIFRECHRVLKERGRLIFTFHHWNPKGWAALTIALKRAGFVLINRYVVHSENPVSVHITNLNSLTDDAILVFAQSDSKERREWNPPYKVDTSDSERFTADCGVVLGWLLNGDFSEQQIEKEWHCRIE